MGLKENKGISLSWSQCITILCTIRPDLVLHDDLSKRLVTSHEAITEKRTKSRVIALLLLTLERESHHPERHLKDIKQLLPSMVPQKVSRICYQSNCSFVRILHHENSELVKACHFLKAISVKTSVNKVNDKGRKFQ